MFLSVCFLVHSYIFFETLKGFQLRKLNLAYAKPHDISRFSSHSLEIVYFVDGVHSIIKYTHWVPVYVILDLY